MANKTEPQESPVDSLIDNKIYITAGACLAPQAIKGADPSTTMLEGLSAELAGNDSPFVHQGLEQLATGAWSENDIAGLQQKYLSRINNLTLEQYGQLLKRIGADNFELEKTISNSKYKNMKIAELPENTYELDVVKPGMLKSLFYKSMLDANAINTQNIEQYEYIKKVQEQVKKLNKLQAQANGKNAS